MCFRLRNTAMRGRSEVPLTFRRIRLRLAPLASTLCLARSIVLFLFAEVDTRLWLPVAGFRFPVSGARTGAPATGNRQPSTVYFPAALPAFRRITSSLYLMPLPLYGS